MKTTKRIVSLSLVLVLVLMLCSCGISREEAIGTWSGTYTYDGSLYSVAFVLSSNGSYAKAVVKNGSLSSSEMGTWEVEGGAVVLHARNGGGTTRYKYKGGALVNNGHKFTKG